MDTCTRSQHCVPTGTSQNQYKSLPFSVFLEQIQENVIFAHTMYYNQGTRLQYFLKSFSISNGKSVKILTNQYSCLFLRHLATPAPTPPGHPCSHATWPPPPGHPCSYAAWPPLFLRRLATPVPTLPGHPCSYAAWPPLFLSLLATPVPTPPGHPCSYATWPPLFLHHCHSK